MSAPPQVRRKDKLMADARALDFLARGYCGRIATVGPDGWPYCVPLLYVWADGEVLVHNAAAGGHFRANVEHEPRVCFEVDEAGEVFDYGRFECNSSVAYCSVVVFGTVRIVQDTAAKQRFFDALMEKYGKPDSGRPKHFYPRPRRHHALRDRAGAHHRQGNAAPRHRGTMARQGPHQIAAGRSLVASGGNIGRGPARLNVAQQVFARMRFRAILGPGPRPGEPLSMAPRPCLWKDAPWFSKSPRLT